MSTWHFHWGQWIRLIFVRTILLSRRPHLAPPPPPPNDCRVICLLVSGSPCFCQGSFTPKSRESFFIDYFPFSVSLCPFIGVNVWWHFFLFIIRLLSSRPGHNRRPLFNQLDSAVKRKDDNSISNHSTDWQSNCYRTKRMHFQSVTSAHWRFCGECCLVCLVACPFALQMSSTRKASHFELCHISFPKRERASREGVSNWDSTLKDRSAFWQID